jgi:tetratricopeptide (TPR) repeat protein
MNRIITLLPILAVALTLATRSASAMQDDYFASATAKLADKDYQGALEDYSKAIKLMPNYAEAYNGRATARTGTGDPDGAIADFTEAIKLKSNYAEAIFGRASERHLSKHDYTGAIADYDALLKLKPDTPFLVSSVPIVYVYYARAAARLNIGQALTDPKGRQREIAPAIADVTKAIELFRADAGGRAGTSQYQICRPCGPGDEDSLGGAFVKRCFIKVNINDASAIEDCTKAIDLDPKDAQAWAFRALARGGNGDKSGAVEDCTKAVSIKAYLRQQVCRNILK